MTWCHFPRNSLDCSCSWHWHQNLPVRRQKVQLSFALLFIPQFHRITSSCNFWNFTFCSTEFIIASSLKLSFENIENIILYFVVVLFLFWKKCWIWYNLEIRFNLHFTCMYGGGWGHAYVIFLKFQCVNQYSFFKALNSVFWQNYFKGHYYIKEKESLSL